MISRTKRFLGPVRQAIKSGAAKVSVEVFQRLMTYSILRNHFGEIAAIPEHGSREDLWKHAIGIIGPERRITYVEFGVHRGHSIRYFAGHNRHSQSEFIGLDSFEGLPEAWGPLRKGTFDTGGSIPVTICYPD